MAAAARAHEPPDMPAATPVGGLRPAAVPPQFVGLDPIEYVRQRMKLATGHMDRIEAGFAAARERAAELSLSAILMLSIKDPATYILQAVVMGRQFSRDKNAFVEGGEPLHPDGYQLKSTLKKCSRCAGNECGREGKFHDLTFDTGPVPVSTAEANRRALTGGQDRVWKGCAVDPETGLFVKRLQAREAIMVLKQWGRWVATQHNGILPTRCFVEEPAFNDAALRAQETEVQPVIPA